MEDELLDNAPDSAEETLEENEDKINSFDSEELEKNVMNAFDDKDKEAVDDGMEVKNETPNAEVPENIPTFELSKNMSLKLGDKITAEHLKELERSFLRESDYTKKTQQIAEQREQSLDIINAHEQIMKDPRALRHHYSDQLLLSAFHPHDLLVNGLKINNIPANEWNEFIEWKKELGEPVQSKQIDPYAQQFGVFQNKISQIESTLNKIHYDKIKQEQDIVYNQQLQTLESEIDSALSKYPNVEKHHLLVELASNKSLENMAIEDIAKQMNVKVQSMIDDKYNNYINNLKDKQKQKVQKPSGNSIPLESRPSKTFDEVNQRLSSVFGVDI